MLSLRCPPDYAQLEAAADRLTDNDASSLAPNRRRDPRRAVRGEIHAGIVPGSCERLTLGRIPVSVFKPVWGGWAVDLSLSGLALVTDRRIPQAQRWWLRLDNFATRPTLLPAFAAGCRKLEPEFSAGLLGGPAVAESTDGTQDPKRSHETQTVETAENGLFRIRFKFQVNQQSLVERLLLDDPETAEVEENELRLVESAAA